MRFGSPVEKSSMPFSIDSTAFSKRSSYPPDLPPLPSPCALLVAIAHSNLQHATTRTDSPVRLWRSDGTREGTYPVPFADVKDVPTDPKLRRVEGAFLYFTAFTRSTGRESCGACASETRGTRPFASEKCANVSGGRPSN